MKYSIIIAVYNRLEEVKELLESAEKLEGNRCLFELLSWMTVRKTGSRNSSNNTTLPPDFKYERYTNKIKVPGLPEITA